MEWSLTGLPLPITLRPPSPLTDDELIAFSEKNKPYRIEKNSMGELFVMSPVGGRGGRRENFVGRELDLWAEANGGYAFGANTGFNLPDGSTFAPDACWVSASRWEALSDREQEKYPPLCPEFVIEVLSESDSKRLAAAKMDLWISNGAQLAWLVDPFAATITIYKAGKDVEVLSRPEIVEAGPPVVGFRLNTTRLWT